MRKQFERRGGLVCAFILALYVVASILGTGVEVKARGMELPEGKCMDGDLVQLAGQMLVSSRSVVDVIEDNIMSGAVRKLFFGSKTPGLLKGIMIRMIGEYITDEVTDVVGLDRDALAQEVYVMACLYYDEIHFNGGGSEAAHDLASNEGVRFILVERMGVSNDDALKIVSMIESASIC